ncbi:HAD-like protein [Fomitiporia mediterranea MF3/22]|uniref:HAD-like protein n=1 Tax=Fomitiporia mediterranea (strain MF3/22) TaxID=694068 RepID=UPI000440772E|nr:HAD-like protein [Fomitiporia mediterranea MF3/22]EJD04244.1 HAD-like protein [Fomitiporia mediterranea MF3/22]
MTIHSIVVDAVLFDMDGTLIDSTPGVMAAWNIFAKDYGLDAETVAHASHGRRLYDTLREFCKIEEDEKLLAEVARFEEEVIKGGPVALPGALELIKQIQSGNPSAEAQRHAWVIATSATNVYTPRALAACGIPIPPAGLVTSNDVAQGKPHPDPYLAAAKRCGVLPENCLVVEDAPSGLNSGRTAGSKTLAVCTSHSKQSILDKSSPDYIAKDLTRVSANWVDGKLEFSIDDSE